MEATLQTKNKNFGLSGFILKILAIICMTIDHATWLWFDSIPYETGMILRTIGRISFPLIVFMLCEGYIYTSNKYKYAARIGIFAIISMYPFYLMTNEPWNILFTLFVGLSCLILKDLAAEKIEKIPKIGWDIIFLVIAGILSYLMLKVDWGFWIIVIYIAGNIDNKKVRAVVISTISFILYLIKELINGMVLAELFNDTWLLIFYAGVFLAIIPMLLYNGKKGFSYGNISKYFFYVYYPLHLLILVFICDGNILP